MTVLKDGNGNKIKMNMMKFKCIYALIAVVLLATACQDEEIIQPVNPGLQGAEITFGARAGFENSNPGSRTEYSGVHYPYNGAEFERIDWVREIPFRYIVLKREVLILHIIQSLDLKMVMKLQEAQVKEKIMRLWNVSVNPACNGGTESIHSMRCILLP